MRCLVAVLLAGSVFLHGNSDAKAYNVFGPFPWDETTDYYLKWGDIFSPGSPGGTITWSLMPDGTTIDPSFTDPNISGTSNLSTILNGLGSEAALETIERVFDRWSDAANIYFEQVDDGGQPFAGANSSAPTHGHIRIGAFAIDGTVGGVGYAPPPNGGPLEGDVLLNLINTFFFDPGDEGDLIQIFNDFESLLMHEVGHALGLAHSDVCSVMSIDFDCFKFVNRELDADDLAGIQFLYGPALQADFDRNHLVSTGDLIAWQAGYGTLSGAIHQTGDADDDQAVTGSDFVLWQRELGSGELLATGNAVQTPEPSTLL
ncbi:MAG: matrixin family metalloprotease, partial [Lacipirellulaceae bacterium]